MTEYLAFAIVVVAGVYLVALGVGCFVRPNFAARFLLGFARSAFEHYLELALRVLVGASLVEMSGAPACPPIFNVFGWVLIVTSLLMFVMPWRWHQQFAQQAVPQALRYITLVGAASIMFGVALAWSVIRSLVV